MIALVSSFDSVVELANCALVASRAFSSARRSFTSSLRERAGTTRAAT